MHAPSLVPSEMVGHIKIPPVLENDVVEEVRVLCGMYVSGSKVIYVFVLTQSTVMRIKQLVLNQGKTKSRS
jgi:hypothetical protein